MPELPEVETTKNSLDPLIGQIITDVSVFQPKLRWPVAGSLDSLHHHQLIAVKRRAKYLILTFVNAALLTQMLKLKFTIKDVPLIFLPSPQMTKQLIIHLGMSGSLQQFAKDSARRKHDHIIFQFNNKQNEVTQLHYHDPRRFGAVLWYRNYQHKLLGHLGIEPLSPDFTGTYMYDLINIPKKNKRSNKFKGITRSVKSVIMDQIFVVGVGNIYATESLFLSGIHPLTPANKLNQAQWATLVDNIKKILTNAIELGGSTLRDFTVASGQTGYFQQTLNVYGKKDQICPHCQTPLENIKINGRASVFCPTCQPLPKT